jgi:hypothetical protein
VVQLELDGFLDRWNDSVIIPFQPDPPNLNDLHTIDWSELDAWAAGNSISVDQKTIATTRRAIHLLFEQRRNYLLLEEIKDRNPSPDMYRMREWEESTLHGTGKGHESYEENFDNDPNCGSCVNYRIISDKTPEEYGICQLWEELASADYGSMKGCCDTHKTSPTWRAKKFDSSNGVGFNHLRKRFGVPLEHNDLKPNWRSISASIYWLIEKEKARLVSGENATVPVDNADDLLIKLQTDTASRVCLNPEWDVYIYARWGTEVNGVWRLQRAPPGRPQVLGYDLHLVLAETLARAYAWNKKDRTYKEHGINQYRAREALCVVATGRNPVNYVTTAEYYQAFVNPGHAGHMADSYMLRQHQDQNAALFTFEHTDLPEGGRFTIDQRLMRWRHWNRDRRRNHQ